MRNLQRRIGRLEDRTAANNQDRLLFTVCRSEVEFALDTHRCVEILRDGGFIPDRCGLAILDFLSVPSGLNAKELERYLRGHGEEICNRRAVAK
jgi:hypothetical protein